MFDITSSKLLLLGIVALLVIGPKDLPALLRTLGKYVGIIRRHANDFRAQFEEAIRESDLDQLKKEVETIGSDTEATMRSAEQAAEQSIAEARQSIDTGTAAELEGPKNTEATPDEGSTPVAAESLNGSSHPGMESAEAGQAASESPPAGQTAEKSGA
jgi:sec-independent protein translocase protein TatB